MPPPHKLECCRLQRPRHRRSQPRFVAGVKPPDFAIVERVNLIGGACLSMYHEPELLGSASRCQCSQPFTVFLHQRERLLLALRRIWCCRRSSSRAGGTGGCQWSPSARPARAPASCADSSSSISWSMVAILSTIQVIAITSPRACLIECRRHRAKYINIQAMKKSNSKQTSAYSVKA